MEKIKIGKVVNVVGLSGAVKIYSYAQDPSRFDMIDTLYIGDDSYEIKSVRHKGNTPVVELSGINDRDGAEALREKDVFMSSGDLEDTEDGEYYVKDLLGLRVTEKGRTVGVLKDIIQNGPQDVYDVDGEKGRVLIPAVPQFIKNIDVDAGVIEVELIEGMEPK